jgi:hypothetical protein
MKKGYAAVDYQVFDETCGCINRNMHSITELDHFTLKLRDGIKVRNEGRISIPYWPLMVGAAITIDM